MLFLLQLLTNCCNSFNSKNRELQVFRYNESDNISSLDPAFARNLENVGACNQLYTGLVQLDNQLNVLPDIASRWVISKDMKQYNFYLRKDVFFHKNECFSNTKKTRNVVAQDFTYSFNRLIDPKVASSGSWVMDYVKNYKALNDTTLVINLKKPFPAFLSLLSTKYCSVVPKEALSFYGTDFRKKPVGTGPFQFKAWEENTKLVFRKNPLFYEKDSLGIRLPYLEAIAITFLPDKQAEFLQFIQGNLDILRSIDNSYKDELLTPKGNLNPNYANNVVLRKTPSLNSEYIGFFLGNDNNPLKNKNLRKAINYGFDRKAMITYLRNNIGIPAENGFIPKEIPGHNGQNGFTYQPLLAKQYYKTYLKESNNSKLNLTLGTNADYIHICEYIQRELQKIGIPIKVELMTASSLRAKKKAGQLSLFRSSWIADYPDAENFMIPFIKEKFAPNGPNYTHFKNPTFEKLYRKSFTIPDINERKFIYEKLDSILIEEAPIIPLYYDEVIFFDKKNVVGIPNNAQSFLYLKTAKKLKEE